MAKLLSGGVARSFGTPARLLGSYATIHSKLGLKPAVVECNGLSSTSKINFACCATGSFRPPNENFYLPVRRNSTNHGHVGLLDATPEEFKTILSKTGPQLTVLNILNEKTQASTCVENIFYVSTNDDNIPDDDNSVCRNVENVLLTSTRRAYFAYDEKRCVPLASDTSLNTICEHFQADPLNYRGHECVFLEVGKRSNALLGTFIWRTNRGQACGGIRMWKYSNMKDFLTDGLRLSMGMGHKSALAGLWSGGGKGLIHAPPNYKDPAVRRDIFHDYGDFLTSLNGCYVGAEDVGLTVSDLDHVHDRTRFVACTSPEIGGSGNPSDATGRGVVSAMEAALAFREMGNLQGKKVVIQGAGHVATIIIDELLDREAGEIVASECDEDRFQQTVEKYRNNANVRVVKTDRDDLSILHEPCDILSPCALGGILNEQTIEKIQAPIICGAANNQLATPEDNLSLDRRGITYVVDFAANRMGIVNCANEAYGYIKDDPYVKQHLGREWENSVFRIVLHILETSRDKGITSVQAAEELAEKLSRENHPIWGHRSIEIIRSLIETNWQNRG